MSKLNPYMHFKDSARRTMEFYRSVFGGELTLTTFKEGMGQDGPDAEKIMHAMLVVAPEMTIMASDTPSSMQTNPGSTVGMSLSSDHVDAEKLTQYWHKLSEGANIIVPLNLSPWGDTFGMLTDKFGIEWMVNIAVKKD